MKKIAFIIFSAITFYCNSQEKIALTTGDTLLGNVSEIDEVHSRINKSDGTSLIILSNLIKSIHRIPSTFEQNSDSLFNRIQAISNRGVDFFNVDGIEITSQTIQTEFSKKNILKNFKSFSLRESDLNKSDSILNNKNYYVSKSHEICSGVIEYATYYFIENSNKGLTGICFISTNKNDITFEREFVTHIKNNSIPNKIFTSLQINSINFAGREIPLGSNCRWMGTNNVQCPNNGQMNWSVHKSLKDATQCINDQFKIIKSKRNGKIISEVIVDVTFEGTETKAQKIIYDLTGTTSALASMSGGKTLTVYFVSAPVRQNFVSCVMSYWNNDSVNPSGLPTLLDQIMTLKK